MAESKLVKLNFENNSYSVYSVILISDLVVTTLFMHSLPGMILQYCSFITSFYTHVFAWCHDTSSCGPHFP